MLFFTFKNGCSLINAHVCFYAAVDGEVQPYTTDLEYLEDNFLLIETLGKAQKMEDDDNLLFRSDQRKPEAVIREMRAKSRSLRAKINQKMEATIKLEGTQMCDVTSNR